MSLEHRFKKSVTGNITLDWCNWCYNFRTDCQCEEGYREGLTLEMAEEWLKADPDNFVLVKYYTADSLEKLLSDEKFWFNSLNAKSETATLKDWLTAHPDGCRLLNSNKANVDTSYQDEPICPWCGMGQGAPDDHSDGEEHCSFCEKKFKVTAEYSIHYTTERA